MKEPMIYYSHPIAGKKGVDAKSHEEYQKLSVDYEYENENCKIAVRNVQWLRNAFPQVRWYCPGEVEIPIQTARQLNLLLPKQVMDLDYVVIERRCHGGLLHLWQPSRGVLEEKKKLETLQYPSLMIPGTKEIWECDLGRIQNFVRRTINFSKERNRNGTK